MGTKLSLHIQHVGAPLTYKVVEVCSSNIYDIYFNNT